MMAMDCYEICVRSRLGSGCAMAFEQLTLCHEPNGEKIFIGCVADQMALHGVHMKNRDMGLQLLSVDQVDSN